jgi:hypothetical protein
MTAAIREIMSFATKSFIAIQASLSLASPTEGNVAQQKCGASRFESLMAKGTLVRGSTSLSVTDRRQSVGKPLAPGEVLFYANLAEAKKVYRTKKQIEVIDSSPMTPDLRIPAAAQLPVVATFTANSGRRYDLVGVGGGYNRFLAMVDDAGFMCSDRLNDQLVAVGDPTVYQQDPLVAEAADPGLAKPRSQAVAVTFLGLSGASASFEVAIMVNGVVEAKKVSSFDAFSPNVQLGDLSFAIKVDGGALTVSSLTEPTDYVRFLGELRAGMRR